MFNNEIVMSIPQFNAYERGEKTIKDIKLENGLEDLAGHILNDKRLVRLTTFAIAGLNVAIPVLADAGEAVAKINDAGSIFLGIFQSLAFWLCLIGVIMEILKSVMNGCGRDVGKIMLKYLLIFASVYLMPFAFNLIREIFS